MKLLRMNGGLGNQLFQYIFLRYLEINKKEEIIIDDIEFFYPNTNAQPDTTVGGYSIERLFGIKKKRLSEMLDKDVFIYLVDKSRTPEEPGKKNRGILNLFKASGTTLFTVQEGEVMQNEREDIGSYYTTPINGFDPNVLNFYGDIYYYGYWINGQYYASIANTILKELKFPELPNDENREYMKRIKEADQSSVALHIRRGDFVTLGIAIDNSIYKMMIDHIRKKIPDPAFFVFSDDMAWVKENFQQIGLKTTDNITYVDINDILHGYIDMQLMKECRGMVFPNSSFSYLACLLNTRTDKIAIQPTPRQIVMFTN